MPVVLSGTTYTVALTYHVVAPEPAAAWWFEWSYVALSPDCVAIRIPGVQPDVVLKQM
jgi:hypothetical protein